MVVIDSMDDHWRRARRAVRRVWAVQRADRSRWRSDWREEMVEERRWRRDWWEECWWVREEWISRVRVERGEWVRVERVASWCWAWLSAVWMCWCRLDSPVVSFPSNFSIPCFLTSLSDSNCLSRFSTFSSASPITASLSPLPSCISSSVSSFNLPLSSAMAAARILSPLSLRLLISFSSKTSALSCVCICCNWLSMSLACSALRDYSDNTRWLTLYCS